MSSQPSTASVIPGQLTGLASLRLLRMLSTDGARRLIPFNQLRETRGRMPHKDPERSRSPRAGPAEKQ